MIDSEGHIYLLQAEGIHRFKIEFSQQNLSRNQIINDVSPFSLKVVEIFPSFNPEFDLAKLYEIFTAHRVQSDWFEFDSPEYATGLIQEYFRIHQGNSQQINELSQQLKTTSQKLKQAEEKLSRLEQDFKRLQEERDRLFEFKVTIQRDISRILCRLDLNALHRSSLYSEQSLRYAAIQQSRQVFGSENHKRRLQWGDTVIMIGLPLADYQAKFAQLKTTLAKYSIAPEDGNSQEYAIELGVPIGIYFTTDKPYARLEIEVPQQYWSLPGMVPDLFQELKTQEFEARYCRLVQIEEDGDTGELAFVPSDSLEEIWQEVLVHIKPLGIQTLIRQHGILIELSPDQTRIGINSRTLLKMLQDKIQSLESAFEETLGVRFSVNLELVNE